MAFLYMLECSDGSYYTGIAADIERRLAEHVEGGAKGAKYTRAHPPLRVVALWETPDLRVAAKGEYAVKLLPRKEKVALVRAPGTIAARCSGLKGLSFVARKELPEMPPKE